MNSHGSLSRARKFLMKWEYTPDQIILFEREVAYANFVGENIDSDTL